MDGAMDGIMDGPTDGASNGAKDGVKDGARDGIEDGLVLGISQGTQKGPGGVNARSGSDVLAQLVPWNMCSTRAVGSILDPQVQKSILRLTAFLKMLRNSEPARMSHDEIS